MPHSVRVGNNANLSAFPSSSSGVVLRPMSRVAFFQHKDGATKFDMGAKFTKIAPAPSNHLARARQSPYLCHMAHRKRENYLHSIGTLKEFETEEKDTSRLEHNLRSQLSKIISPIKAPSSFWKSKGGAAIAGSERSSSNMHDAAPPGRGYNKLHPRNQLHANRTKVGGPRRHRGLEAGAYLDDKHFSVSPTSSFSGEDELWSGANHFRPTMNHSIVATPGTTMSDISDFDRDITPSQFSDATFTASASSGIYGDFEDEVVNGGVDDYEFIGELTD